MAGTKICSPNSLVNENEQSLEGIARYNYPDECTAYTNFTCDEKKIRMHEVVRIQAPRMIILRWTSISRHRRKRQP